MISCHLLLEEGHNKFKWLCVYNIDLTWLLTILRGRKNRPSRISFPLYKPIWVLRCLDTHRNINPLRITTHNIWSLHIKKCQFTHNKTLNLFCRLVCSRLSSNSLNSVPKWEFCVFYNTITCFIVWQWMKVCLWMTINFR